MRVRYTKGKLAKDTPDSDNDTTCAELKADEGYKSSVNNGTISRSCSRPMSICSEPEKKWVDVVAVPLMMAYVTRYIYGTDKLRQNAFEVRGINGTSTGIIHCDDLAILSQWLKLINDNVVGLTHLQMKLYNRNFAVGERIEYMGWVNEGVINNNISWQSYKPRFLVLKGTEVMLFETPPERMVQITRQKQGGLGLSIKGGAEHKLPILISRIYKDQAADITGQLFVGDAIIKVNGEYITACPHDDAVNILRNAGDIVVLTVKHYRAATPFLQKQY
ncbi:gamma-2-syntrophin [Lucilia cuprina]|uniref:gamma-2-syntrophin n=1 Tax=Lucilia cuprina TaxID=7375 RepID=UPI001F060DB2|nr:gamma-2-syntrophin [Lucilia cuprina]